ncbi:MAG: endopeptidase La [Thermoanaerobaculia bacterium]
MSEKEEKFKIPDLLPLLPLKDTVIFPGAMVPLFIGRQKSMRAVDDALASNRMILLSSQKSPEIEDPKPEDIFSVGTVSIILRMVKLSEGQVRILIQGISRAKIDMVTKTDPHLQAKITLINEEEVPKDSIEVQALIRTVLENLEKLVSMGKPFSEELKAMAQNIEQPGRLADFISSNLDLKVPESQEILELIDPIKRLKRVNELLTHEIMLLSVQQEILSEAQQEMDKSHREYILRQQLKAIQKELGESEELKGEIEGYKKAIEEKKIPEEAKTEIEKQISRLEKMAPDSPEANVIRTYLDTITSLPWAIVTKDRLNLKRARKILDEDHYDLEKVKERILEFLAVRKLKGSKIKGPILCFVGPPGVGKTSLGRSIARCLGRKFVRISLGGVRDEAEIRGHRRTYIGAMPGRIITGILQAGSSNPVFMLDEIDKIGADFRGDPSAALLEVLDPEQNFSFRDHYLGVSYDLSKVLFIATANILDTIHPAFLDRMEVIHLSGYITEEKVQIAYKYLIPKQLKENGISQKHLYFTEKGLKKIISQYTREVGLRNLEREIGSICRKVAVEVAAGKWQERKTITEKAVEKYLGPPKYLPEILLKKDEVGIATGLAWTPFGGDILFIEAILTPGNGKIQLTGHLGEVMKESALAALSYTKAKAKNFSIPLKNFKDKDIHIHVPEGAIPKDGPSAGVTMACAMISALSGIPIRRDVAMTGEITLRGEVLPVGGIKEKVIAARTAMIKDIILPSMNKKDLSEIPKNLLKGLNFHFIERVEEAVKIALKNA